MAGPVIVLEQEQHGNRERSKKSEINGGEPGAFHQNAESVVHHGKSRSDALVVKSLPFHFLLPEKVHDAEPVFWRQRDRWKSEFAHRCTHIPANPCIRLAPRAI